MAQTQEKDQDLGAPQFAYHAVVEPIVCTINPPVDFSDNNEAIACASVNVE